MTGETWDQKVLRAKRTAKARKESKATQELEDVLDQLDLANLKDELLSIPD